MLYVAYYQPQFHHFLISRIILLTSSLCSVIRGDIPVEDKVLEERLKDDLNLHLYVCAFIAKLLPINRLLSLAYSQWVIITMTYHSVFIH